MERDVDFDITDGVHATSFHRVQTPHGDAGDESSSFVMSTSCLKAPGPDVIVAIEMLKAALHVSRLIMLFPCGNISHAGDFPEVLP